MKTYNGYKNWETWNVALWLNNSEKAHNMAKGVPVEDLRFLCEEEELIGDFVYLRYDNVDWFEVYNAVNA